MDKKVGSLRWVRTVGNFLVLCMLASMIASFFFEQIENHRIQCGSFFLGLGMVLWGIAIRAKENFVYPIAMFGKKTVVKKEGKRAKIIGSIIFIVGILVSIWGGLFWVAFIRNIWTLRNPTL